jgi:hypothetical protein
VTETTSRDNPHENVSKLWRHILGGERGLLSVWTGLRDERGGIPRETIKDAVFNFPKAAALAAEWALERAAEGREVYFCAHLLDKPRRIKENAASVIALWGDLDGAPIPNGELKPTAVVESSPGRYHAYWRLTDAIPPETAERLNARLAHKIGADPSGFDLTQLLRVPETTNYKYEGRPLVRVLGVEGERAYSPAALDELLPDLEEPEADYAPGDAEEPPVVLTPEALKVYRGERPKLKEDGTVDRSATLIKIARELYEAGANRQTVITAIAERDRTLGYKKYTGNRDGGRKEYERLFAKLGERTRRAHVTVGGARERAEASDHNVSDFQDLADLPDPDEFPLDALPINLRRFAREAAASVGCPVDYLGIATLTAASAAIGDTRRIDIKKDWTEGAAIFGMIVGGPASKKTPAMNLALRPVRERQMVLKTEYERQKEEYESALRDFEKAKKDGPSELRKPDKPKLGRTYVDDTTVERLADVLNENRRGVLLTKDELSGWLGSFDQYKTGKGADRQFWLSVHTNQPVSVDRKSSEEPVLVPRPFVSIVGEIQPEVLPDFGKDRGDGLIDRFIPAYPKPWVGRWTDDEISDHVREEYARTLSSLYKLRHANEEDEPFPSRVHMTAEAKEIFVAEYNRLHDELEALGFPQRLRPAWGKLEAYLARFALIIAMARVCELGVSNDSNVSNDSDFREFREFREKVTREDMVGAAKLLAYFKNHVRRVYTGLYGDSTANRLEGDLREFLISIGNVWEGIASELHWDLVSEYKPERPEDLAKAVRGIAKRSSVLKLEDLQRTRDRRPFRLTLENAVIADIAVMPSSGDEEGTAGPDPGQTEPRRVTEAFDSDEGEQRVQRLIADGWTAEEARAQVLSLGLGK